MPLILSAMQLQTTIDLSRIAGPCIVGNSSVSSKLLLVDVRSHRVFEPIYLTILKNSNIGYNLDTDLDGLKEAVNSILICTEQQGVCTHRSLLQMIH